MNRHFSITRIKTCVLFQRYFLAFIVLFSGLSHAQTPVTSFKIQTSPTSPLSFTSTGEVPTNEYIYSTHIFRTSRSFTSHFGTSYPSASTNSNILVGFNAGGRTFRRVSNSVSTPFNKVNIQRVDNVAYTGNRFSGFFVYSSVRRLSGVETYNVRDNDNLQIFIDSSPISTMSEAINNFSLSYGSDNIFSNYGTGNSGRQGNNYAETGNNIERVDLIYQPGIGATSVAGLSGVGVLINDRGGNDSFKIAAITGLDGSGNVSSLGNVLSIASSAWQTPTGPAVSTIVFMGSEGAGNFKPKELISMAADTLGPPLTQNVGGVFVSLADLGIPVNTKVYGYALFPGDITSNYLTLTGTPTNTPDAGVGGLDLMSGNMVVVDTSNYDVLAQKLSGKVWHDSNSDGTSAGETNISGTNTPAGSSIAIGGSLYVNIVQSGIIVASVPVQSDGTYSWDGMLPGVDYTLFLSNTSGSLGSPASTITTSLPPLWRNTKENLDGVIDSSGPGEIAFTSPLSGDVVNYDFGLQKEPVADPYSFNLGATPPSGTNIVLNGTYTSAQEIPTRLTGKDLEDGNYIDGSSATTTIKITSLLTTTGGTASGGTPILLYNGVPVTAGQIINNYDPTKLSVTLNGTGYTGVSFQYQVIDSGGLESPPATYAITWSGPLPVRLKSLTVIVTDNIPTLTWVTSSEINVGGFQIERSADLANWSVLGFVRSEGNSFKEVTYHFSDKANPYALVYYRLKMIDLDNAYSYSKTISTSLFLNGVNSVVYPNPATEKIFISNLLRSEEEAVISGHIISGSGAIVQNFPKEGLTSGVSIANIPNGAYIIKLQLVTGETRVYRFVKLR